ncbi:alkaline phosphatase [Lentzea guizhouensis]|uniref:Alkaline phosphatase n=1 Tax=Lentzea guizhouensis TaxID=1586287 RepID=A0A1B2HJ96_9PSEU|nr:alkaline phosphatase D family protein [Lentzea guizhouensis]ANZ37808.1 alkaline phosphatase [Lentzea guizhouensis]
MSGVGRRTFLKATAAAGAATTAVSGTAHASSAPVFEHGVASGDPLPDGVLLWTRVVTTAPVRWEVARDATFTRVVARGRTTTGAHRDHTVKVEVSGLRPATHYYYRFTTADVVSPVGRTKTAPRPSDDCGSLRFGVVSCSNWIAGHFAAYGYLASRDDLDAVIHLGDYVYEYFEPGVRVTEPQRECETVDDYRTRHAQYKTDPHLRALHAAHPVIATWDDHESAENSSAIGSPVHDPATEGPWAIRLAAATQAYFEWMPVREGKLTRRLQFGRLADLTMLDLRSYRTDTTILGTAQRNWLASSLTDGCVRWKLVGNSVMLAPLKIPPLPGLPPTNTDQWDGFPADRDHVLRALDRAGMKNAVFLTGDIHSSWAIDVPFGETTVATEFVSTSVTSDNFDERIGVPPRTASLQIEAQFRALNPHVKFVELDSHGAQVLTVTPEQVQMDWHYVADKRDPNTATTKAHSWRTQHNMAQVEQVL